MRTEIEEHVEARGGGRTAVAAQGAEGALVPTEPIALRQDAALEVFVDVVRHGHVDVQQGHVHAEAQQAGHVEPPRPPARVRPCPL